jgi:hypothetical protein
MLHEVYRFGTQIQDVCEQVFLRCEKLGPAIRKFARVFYCPSFVAHQCGGFAWHSRSECFLGMLDLKVTEGRPEDE